MHYWCLTPLSTIFKLYCYIIPPEVLAVPASHVAPVVLLLNDTNITLIGKSCWTPVYVNTYK